MNLAAKEVAVIGDQIFTDVLGGNRMGLYTIILNRYANKSPIIILFLFLSQTKGLSCPIIMVGKGGFL